MEVTHVLYCGIDVAKHKQAVALLDEQGQKIQPVFAVENSRDGLDRLGETLALLDGPILVGLEATGHYWLSLYEALSGQGYGIVVLNPMQVAAYRKSGIRKIKTDNTDATWIADFVRMANPPAARRDVPILLQLRELSRFRYWLSDQIGDCKRKLLTILDRVFPEYESLFSSVFLRSSRALLQEAVSAQEFASFDLQELTQLLSHSSRGHFGAEKAEQLQSQAQQSVGVSFLVDAARLELHCLLAQMELIEQQQDQVEQALAQLRQQIPQHITSIPGIGLATGAAILAEIGDITRFASPDKLVAYAGVDATVYQTGQFEASHAHMSKRGSPYLRHAFGRQLA
jgi:transposase